MNCPKLKMGTPFERGVFWLGSIIFQSFQENSPSLQRYRSKTSILQGAIWGCWFQVGYHNSIGGYSFLFRPTNRTWTLSSATRPVPNALVLLELVGFPCGVQQQQQQQGANQFMYVLLTKDNHSMVWFLQITMPGNAYEKNLYFLCRIPNFPAYEQR